VAPAPTTTAPAAAAPAAKSPWDADLAERFPDEATRSAVSAYLGEKVQPYVTNLEQSNAQAKELLEDFRTAPKDTFLEVAQELIDAEALSPGDVTEFINSLTPAEQAEVQAQVEGQPPRADLSQLPPEVQEIVNERATEKQRTQEKAAFDAEFARVKAANPTVEFDESLFIPEVARLGDFDSAVASYQERYGPYLAWRKENPLPESTETTTTPAPQTVGSGEAEGGTQPPTQEKYDNLDDAIEAHFAERRATGQSIAPSRPAPPVAAG
jgi:hypothetical protein